MLVSLFFMVLVGTSSCKKDWLDAKPQKNLVVPVTIKDFQSILDNNADLVIQANGIISGSGFNMGQSCLDEVSAGDFVLADNFYAAVSANERNAYVWKDDIFGDDNNYIEWRNPYAKILTSNIVIEGISKIVPKNSTDQVDWNNVLGGALFLRAYNHFNISQVFCKPYNEASADTDLGIPLRLNSDFAEKTTRASVKSTYNVIVDDLKKAVSLLPVSTPINDIYKARPNKAAASAMLARIYLSMRKYDSAGHYANVSLGLYDKLMDYNDLPNINTATPFLQYNDEVLFNMTLNNYGSFRTSRFDAAPGLYSQYDTKDKRRRGYFRTSGGRNIFKGSYDGTALFFSGLATDEVYLIRAESFVRGGRITEALADINHLLERRYERASFQPCTLTDPVELLKFILQERRKELCYRGLRWSDLRRLNTEQGFSTVITRTVNGQIYSLEPNDMSKYVLPIPPDVIALSGIEQN